MHMGDSPIQGHYYTSVIDFDKKKIIEYDDNHFNMMNESELDKQAICRMIGRRNIKCIGYLDDFWISDDSYEACNQALHTLLNLLRKLGFTIS